jgi:hypothetical protein
MAAGALPFRVALGVVCGLLLLGGIAGAALVEEDEGKRTPAAAGTPAADEVTTTTAAAAPGATAPPTTLGGAVTTVTTAGAAGTSPTRAGATTTAAAPRPGSSAPGALVAPKPGAYVYESTSTGSSGSRTDRTTTTVEAAGTEGAATLQNVTIPLDLGGMQATARNTVVWSNAGAVVRRSLITVTSLNGAQLDCAWQPPFAQYAGGLAVGKTWSFTTSCAGKIGAIDVQIEQQATRKVTGSTTVAGPAGQVAVWTIADDTTVVITSPLGAGSARTTGTQQLAPSLGLPVSTDMRAEARQAGQPPQVSTVKTKLVTLPA